MDNKDRFIAGAVGAIDFAVIIGFFMERHY